VGVKYRPDGFNGLFTLAYFDLTQTNVPSWNIDATIQRQIGKVRVKGVELEGKFALDDRWNMTLAYSYWDAAITGDGDSSLIGNRPERVPNQLASAWLSYTIPGDGMRGDLTLGGGARYVGNSYGDRENTVKVGGYTVFDASAKYDFNENLSLQVTARNLFDRKYITTCYYGNCYYGDQRTVLATLKYKW
jgi:iron complex outermembrane receptor protein